jgi:restriction endonuclease S subunit
MKYLSLDDYTKYKEKHQPLFGDVLLSNIGTIGKSIVVDEYSSKIDFLIHWNIFKISPKKDLILPLYLKLCLDKLDRDDYYKKFQTGGTLSFITKKVLVDIEIPLPSIEVQKEIVRELEQYQNIIDGARQVVDNYKPVIDIDSSWEMILLKDLLKLSSGKGLVKRDMIDGQYEVFGGNGISGFHNSYFIEEKTIVIGRVGEYCGVVHITSPKCWITDNGLYVTNYYKEIKLEYLSIILTSLNLNSYAKVGGQPSISQSTILELSIPYPSIEIQQSIVDRIEAERLIIEGNKKLIEIYTKKIQERINNIWGE